MLRMEQSVKTSRRLKRVEEVIAELGITDCQNTMIGSTQHRTTISGGERKRLSFATEVWLSRSRLMDKFAISPLLWPHIALSYILLK